MKILFFVLIVVLVNMISIGFKSNISSEGWNEKTEKLRNYGLRLTTETSKILTSENQNNFIVDSAIVGDWDLRKIGIFQNNIMKANRVSVFQYRILFIQILFLIFYFLNLDVIGAILISLITVLLPMIHRLTAYYLHDEEFLDIVFLPILPSWVILAVGNYLLLMKNEGILNNLLFAWLGYIVLLFGSFLYDFLRRVSQKRQHHKFSDIENNEENYVVYLRSFVDDSIKMRAHISDPNSIFYRFILWPIIPFERLVSLYFYSLNQGNMIAIGHPSDSEKLSPLGAYRTYFPNSFDDGKWQREIKAKIIGAKIIFLIPSEREGVSWEVEQVNNLKVHFKSLILFPPESNEKQKKRMVAVLNKLEKNSVNDSILNEKEFSISSVNSISFESPTKIDWALSPDKAETEYELAIKLFLLSKKIGFQKTLLEYNKIFFSKEYK